MVDTPAPVEVGFAEFTAKLISDVLEAVIMAQLVQERRLAELVAAAELSPAEFAELVISDEETEVELARLFPGSSDDEPSAIYIGAPYQPARDDIPESPPVFDVLGIRLGRGDFTTRRKRTILTGRGVAKIEAEIRLRLAVLQRDSVQQLVRRGLPRVIADAGRVNSKLTYQLERDEEPPAPEAPPVAPATMLTSGSLGYLTQPMELAKLHLKVRPADERAPQNQELAVNVFGEVEITFKTIV